MNGWMEAVGILGQLDVLAPSTGGVGQDVGWQFRDVLLIVAAGLTVGLVLAVGVRYLRRGPKQRKRIVRTDVPRGSDGDAEDEDADEGAEGEESASRKRRRKKRLKRAHRDRNPTLAQTGGLPPQRKDDAPPAG